MSYKFGFADNETYNAADVNKITSRLVTSGVSDPFENGEPYNLSQFNTAGALVYTSGAVPETVSTLKVVSASDGKVRINPGTAFFADGSTIEVEAGGHELEFVPGVKNYVYLKNDLVASNTSYPVCSESEPAGDFVLLAEISEAGEITDKRVYAKGKLPGYGSNALYTMEIADGLNMKHGETITKTYDVGSNTYRFLMSINMNAGRELLGVHSFSDSKYLSYFGIGTGSRGGTTELTLYKGAIDRATATVSLLSGVLTVNVHYSSDSGGTSSGNPVYVPYTLYLF